MHNFNKFILVLASICSIKLYSFEYGLDAKFDGISKISQLQLFSERCSGSNYIANLVSKNIEFYPPAIPYQVFGPYGHKHFPLPFEIPLDQYKGDKKFYTFEGNENTLFIVVFRDPYDWVRSFHRHPHHSIKDLKNLPFTEFIRKKWQLNINDTLIKDAIAHNPFPDRDPITGKLFNNVLKLRTAKIRTMLEIKNRVNNIYYINYETVPVHGGRGLEAA